MSGRKLAIALVALAFLVGIVLGGLLDAYLRSNFLPDVVASSAGAEINTTLYSLYRFRKGDSVKGTEMLESRLDNAAMTLATRLGDTPRSRRDPIYVTVIERFKVYRAAYPHSNGSYLDQALANALSRVD
jgi:hypothetical protein